MLEYLIPVLLPPVIDVVNKDVPGEGKRFFLAVLLSFVVGGIVAFPSIHTGGIHDAHDVLQAFLIVFGEAQIMYRAYWKNSFLRDKLITSLETMFLSTTPVKPEILSSEAAAAPSEPESHTVFS